MWGAGHLVTKAAGCLHDRPILGYFILCQTVFDYKWLISLFYINGSKMLSKLDQPAKFTVCSSKAVLGREQIQDYSPLPVWSCVVNNSFFIFVMERMDWVTPEVSSCSASPWFSGVPVGLYVNRTSPLPGRGAPEVGTEIRWALVSSQEWAQVTGKLGTN